MIMLIRPNLKTWPMVERGQEDKDWSDIPDARPLIESWEKRTGFVVPGDYRRFMLKFNGGRIHPNLLRHNIPADIYPSTEPVTILDPLYSWEYVERIWDRQVFGPGTPPNMLVIGSDPGGLEILLSLRLEDTGAIFGWLHSTNIWGTDGNDRLFRLAGSFAALLDSLFDDAEGTGHRYWHRPGLARLVRKLEF